MLTWNDIKHFHSIEFDSPDQPGSGARMNLDFVSKLDAIHEEIGQPMIIHSGYRTADHNEKVGGVDSSAHTSGHAADIGALSDQSKFELIRAALKIGFRRFGVGASFVHVDDDSTKTQDVCWLYPPSTSRSIL